MTKVLQMLFVNEAGKTVTVSIINPKDALTEAQVQATMQTIVTKNVFVTSGGALASASGARVVSRGVESVF
ncbi:MAG: DUF2922 domain-containing protein [bacterium]|nr:DUF2922 domain-containing protein [bacterium]